MHFDRRNIEEIRLLSPSGESHEVIPNDALNRR